MEDQNVNLGELKKKQTKNLNKKKKLKKKNLRELRLSGNHTVMEYEMSREPYSQKSGWIIHSNEQIFQVMTLK